MYADKLVLITGGSSGIGKTLAVAFLREEARVLIVSHRPEVLARAEAELRAVSAMAHALRCDLGDPADVAGLGHYAVTNSPASSLIGGCYAY